MTLKTKYFLSKVLENGKWKVLCAADAAELPACPTDEAINLSHRCDGWCALCVPHEGDCSTMLCKY